MYCSEVMTLTTIISVLVLAYNGLAFQMLPDLTQVMQIVVDFLNTPVALHHNVACGLSPYESYILWHNIQYNK